MTVLFTEEEKKYIVTSKGNWRIAPDCPLNIKLNLERKIKNINNHKG